MSIAHASLGCFVMAWGYAVCSFKRSVAKAADLGITCIFTSAQHACFTCCNAFLSSWLNKCCFRADPSLFWHCCLLLCAVLTKPSHTLTCVVQLLLAQLVLMHGTCAWTDQEGKPCRKLWMNCKYYLGFIDSRKHVVVNHVFVLNDHIGGSPPSKSNSHTKQT